MNPWLYSSGVVSVIIAFIYLCGSILHAINLRVCGIAYFKYVGFGIRNCMECITVVIRVSTYAFSDKNYNNIGVNNNFASLVPLVE